MKITKADVGRTLILRNGKKAKIKHWDLKARTYQVDCECEKKFICFTAQGLNWPDAVSDYDAIRFADVRPENPETFKRGDAVQWTSQASGYSKKKRGVVHEVVSETRMPRKMPSDSRALMPRNHRSYIVKTDDGKLYWPLVKYLKPVKRNGTGRA